MNCPICKSKKVNLITNKLRFDKEAKVNICMYCSLVYLDQDSFSLPKNFYETEYHQTYLSHIDPEIMNPEKHYIKMKSASSIWANKIKDMLSGQEILLDFGCSTGHLITEIKDKTKSIFGHELSKKEVEFCQTNLGLDVDSKPLQERFSFEYFDVITMVFVLEHIGKPLELLEEIKKFLKKEGRLIIIVPNIMDPLVNFYKLDDFRKFYFCIEHLFYYSKITLENILNMSGYNTSTEIIQEYPITNHLSWIYKNKPQDAIASRSVTPLVEIQDHNLQDDWCILWNDFNNRYKDLISKHGYGDRLFCVARKK
jgi:2-polyprenyl-3-methyl-5-hydroxy-6-metoxy-1,4-benzoquinol methylase